MGSCTREDDLSPLPSQPRPVVGIPSRDLHDPAGWITRWGTQPQMGATDMRSFIPVGSCRPTVPCSKIP
jgi:hypothetical protein